MEHLIITCALIIATVVLAAVIILLSAYLFFNNIYLPFKHRSVPMSAVELTEMISTITNTQISLYEKNVFKKIGALDNSTFETYMQHICNDIYDSFSDDFWFRISFVMKEDMVATIIAKTVTQYLTKKVLEKDNNIYGGQINTEVDE